MMLQEGRAGAEAPAATAFGGGTQANNNSSAKQSSAAPLRATTGASAQKTGWSVDVPWGCQASTVKRVCCFCKQSSLRIFDQNFKGCFFFISSSSHPSETSVRFPRFFGKGFIEFPAIVAAERNFDIRVQFKPEAADGLLLFTAEHPNAVFDYFSVSLIAARVDFRWSPVSVSHTNAILITFQPPFNHHSTTVQPPFNHHSTTVQPPFNHHSTTVQPPFNHHSTTIQPPFNHHSTTIQPLFNHRSTTIQPPFSHHSTTIQSPFNHHSTTIQPTFNHHSTTIQPSFNHHPITIKYPLLEGSTVAQAWQSCAASKKSACANGTKCSLAGTRDTPSSS